MKLIWNYGMFWKVFQVGPVQLLCFRNNPHDYFFIIQEINHPSLSKFYLNTRRSRCNNNELDVTVKNPAGQSMIAMDHDQILRSMIYIFFNVNNRMIHLFWTIWLREGFFFFGRDCKKVLEIEIVEMAINWKFKR